jgi:NLI interacting factor-like phosphatase
VQRPARTRCFRISCPLSATRACAPSPSTSSADSRARWLLAEPGTDALLPDLLPFQRQARMRTLVLDLDGVLVQSVWQRKHGWKTVKRPGVEPFLETMAQYYELVVFTNRSHSYADPILNRIDPGIQQNQGPVVMYRLYKNSTQWRVRFVSFQFLSVGHSVSAAMCRLTTSRRSGRRRARVIVQTSVFAVVRLLCCARTRPSGGKAVSSSVSILSWLQCA